MQYTQKATTARKARSQDEEWDLYEKISEMPKLSVYELAKLMSWTTGKTRGAVKRLEAEGLVKMKKTIRGGRAVDQVTPIPWQDMLTLEELEDFRKMEI